MDADADPRRLREAVCQWYATHARDLPWRRADTSAWGVLVSEFMLQQTQVSRVLPAYRAWLARWPTAAALAADRPGDAVRAWGRLGYPRRALRLHATARAVVERHGGRVPDDVAALRDLPGVGDYTAAAVAAFAYRRRTVVLDINVRRVLGRLLRGAAHPTSSSPGVDERAAAAALLPDDPSEAAGWSVAVMELGALVCRARSPRCGECPVALDCRWLAAGRPAGTDRGPPPQRYAGTDRQARGRLLAVLRDSAGPASRVELELAWDEPVQRARALDGLVADGLVEPVGTHAYALPGQRHLTRPVSGH